MAAPLKKYKEEMIKTTAAKVVKLKAVKTNSVINSTEVVQARKQAKKIMQALHEAEQIKEGKIIATTFEEYFGKV